MDDYDDEIRARASVLKAEEDAFPTPAAAPSAPAPAEVKMPEPVAYAIMSWGSVQRLVVRADVADEWESSRRQMYPPAANVHTVPLYSAAYAAAREAAERERVRGVNEELAMMIRMLASSLKRHWPHAPQPGDLPSRAVDLLRRHELLGSPLREEPGDAAPKAARAELGEGR